MSHNERCKECKVRVRELLEKIYGQVITNYRIPLGTKPEALHEHPWYRALSEIYTALQDHRGFTDFVRASFVDVDFFLPEQNMIVEFDESQHFTEPRRIALSHYPSDLKTGFSRECWMKHCDETRAYDNDPPFRDEQRAWYDTLRDFIPAIKGFWPTVRLYSREMEWCKLNPEKSEDVEKIKTMLQIPTMGPENWLATMTLESNSYKYPDNDSAKNERKNADRMSALRRITTSLAHTYSGTGIVLYPGGYLHSGTGEVASTIPTIVDQIRPLLQDIYSTTSSTLVVCLGIDGKVLLEEGPKYRYDAHQVAIAVSKDGLIAYAKKFYPTDDIETQVVDLAGDYLSPEQLGKNKYPRIFQIAGKSFYLAECNDIKGLKKYSKPESVDCVLNCVHGCYNLEEGPTCSYFVRLNFAGVSQHWKCPVFGAVVFFKRKIAEKWRTGILYRTWGRDPISCETDENALAPLQTDSSYLLEEGRAQVDVYDLDATFKGSPVYRKQLQINQPAPRSDPSVNATNVQSQLPVDSTLYRQLREELDPLFGKSVIEQKTKFTYRGKNEIGYPKKTELDMISLFKPTKHNERGVRFRIYPHVLAGHTGLRDANRIYDALPVGSVEKHEHNNPQKGAIFIEGSFSYTEEVERFVKWLMFGKD